MIASNTLVEVSGGGDYYWESDSLYLFDRSLAVVEVAVLEVVDVKVATFSIAVVKVTILSVAVVKVATVLEVVDVKVDPYSKCS